MTKHDGQAWEGGNLSAEEKLALAVAEIHRLRSYITADAEKYTVLATEVARLRSEAMPLVETCEALRALLATEREKTEHSVPMESILAARDLYDIGTPEYDAVDDIVAGKWGIGG